MVAQDKLGKTRREVEWWRRSINGTVVLGMDLFLLWYNPAPIVGLHWADYTAALALPCI